MYSIYNLYQFYFIFFQIFVYSLPISHTYIICKEKIEMKEKALRRKSKPQQKKTKSKPQPQTKQTVLFLFFFSFFLTQMVRFRRYNTYSSLYNIMRHFPIEYLIFNNNNHIMYKIHTYPSLSSKQKSILENHSEREREKVIFFNNYEYYNIKKKVYTK